jgi:hypothetical protein
MTHPFWFSEDRWAARGLLLAVIALNLVLQGVIERVIPLIRRRLI